MRKVFLEDLPRWGKGANIGKINWSESVGRKVKFVYDEFEGNFEISEVFNKVEKINLKYKGDIFTINIESFKLCNIYKIIQKDVRELNIYILERHMMMRIEI